MLNSRSLIRDKFELLLKEVGLRLVYRADNHLKWCQEYESLYRRCVEVSSAALDYHIEYEKSNKRHLEDISVILLMNGQAVALWPLFVCVNSGRSQLTSPGGLISSPFFLRNISHSLQTKISKSCYKVCIELASYLGHEEIFSRSFDPASPCLSPWHLYALQLGASCSVRHEALVDLNQPIQDIKASFRKSYKSLINRSEKIWSAYVVPISDLCDEWPKFKALHIKVSGRQTRSDHSWMLQKQSALNNEGFLVVVYRNNNLSRELIGAGFFEVSSYEGVYSVGAYDRSLFDQPVSHIVQLRAIEELKRRGCDWYYIGRCHFPGDSPLPEQKELSISLFKSGFANHFSCSYELSHTLDYDHDGS